MTKQMWNSTGGERIGKDLRDLSENAKPPWEGIVQKTEKISSSQQTEPIKCAKLLYLNHNIPLKMIFKGIAVTPLAIP